MATRDPGLQPERTALSWGRTSLSMAANALLLLRSGLAADQRAVTALGVALLVGTAWTLSQAARRRREFADAAVAPAISPAAPLLLVAWVFIAAVGAVLSALDGLR